MQVNRGGLSRVLRCAVAAATCIVLISNESRAAIVDTLAGFDPDETGFSGALETGFSVKGGNTETESFSGAARVQWQRGRERVRFLAGGTYESADGERTEEDVLLHLRHNHRLASWVRSLLFTQLQTNPFQRLESRTLFGAGARFEPFTRKQIELAIGMASMVELEQIDGETGTTTEYRLSSFVTIFSSPREGLTIDATAFVQPRWDQFDDVRVSARASVRSRVIGPVSLVVSSSYIYDHDPPEDVDREDWHVQSSIRVAL